MSDKVDPTYRKKIEDVKVEGEDYANSQMNDVYSEQKKALDEVNILVGALFLRYAKDGLLNLTTTQKNQALAEVKEKLKAMGAKLGKNEVDTVTQILGDVFKNTYYENAFIMENSFNVELKFNILKQEFIDKAVLQKFKGELFSDRIWKNKSDMIDLLQSSIIEAMKGNVHLDKVGRNIRDTFNTSAYESKRLVFTETSRIQSQAQLQIGLDSGVKQVMWSATLDTKTAELDASLDGKVWSINEDHPMPPLHPNCRCVLINIPYSGWKATSRKDNQSKDITSYQTYSEWAKAKKIPND